MKQALVIAGLMCVGASARAVAPVPVPTTFDPQGYYHVRQDYRKCMAPLCGGWWVSLVNNRGLTCADGSVQKECYVADILTAPGAPFQLTLPKQLLKGELSSKVWSGRPLGVFHLTADHSQASKAEGTGYFLGMRNTNVVCITTPCPTMKGHLLNTRKSLGVSDISFAKSLDPAVVSWAQKTMAAGEAVAVAATFFRVTGPAGRGVGVAVNQIYVPVTCPEGYALSDGKCRTPHGCGYPEIELTGIGGAPMVDPITGEVTSSITKSCVKSCDPPAFPTGPGQCTIAFP